MSGFATLHRQALEHPLLMNDAARLGAWTWLILRAAWKPTPYNVGGSIVTLERGQLCASRSQLAKAWGMSPSAVERFLTRLETEQMIGRATGQGRTIITICNYSIYQDISDEAGQVTGQATGQPPDSHRTTKEQGNQGTIEIPSEAKASSGSSFENDLDVAPDDSFQAPAKPKTEPTPIEHALDCYAKAADISGWPTIRTLTEARKKKLRSRLKEIGIERWKDALRVALKSPYLGTDPPSWFTFDWLTKNPENILKVLEGNYDNRSDGKHQSAPQHSSNQLTESARRFAQLQPSETQRGSEQRGYADSAGSHALIADGRH